MRTGHNIVAYSRWLRKYEADMLKNLLIRQDYIHIHVNELFVLVNSGKEVAGRNIGLGRVSGKAFSLYLLHRLNESYATYGFISKGRNHEH